MDNNKIKVVHTFLDGTVETSVEGIIVPSKVSEKIVNILKKQSHKENIQ